MKENITNNEINHSSKANFFIEIDEKDEWEKKSCCCKCCHYLFCCCCCIKYEKSKNFYKKGWRNYLKKEGNETADSMGRDAGDMRSGLCVRHRKSS